MECWVHAAYALSLFYEIVRKIGLLMSIITSFRFSQKINDSYWQINSCMSAGL